MHNGAQFHLEHPSFQAPLAAGSHLLRGWAVDASGAPFVDLRLRTGDSIQLAVYGFPRRDLALHFKSRSPFLLAEFEVRLDLPPGDVTVEFEALDITGRWDSIGRITFQVTGSGFSPSHPAPVAPLRAHEFARILRLFLQRQTIGPEQKLPDLARNLVAELPWPRDLRHPHLPFHGYLDEPAVVARAGFGRLTVLGYLFHETQSIRRVFATVDLQAAQTFELHRQSMIAPVLFPQFAHAGQSGVFGIIDVPAQLPQPLCVRVYAELEDGSVHLCSVQRARAYDAEEEKILYPLFSLFRFWRSSRALKQAIHAAGIPLESGRSLRAKIKETWRDYSSRAPRHPPISNALLPVAPIAPHPLSHVVLLTHNLSREGAPLFLLEYAAYLTRSGQAKLTVFSPVEGPLRRDFEHLGASVTLLDLTELNQAVTAGELRHFVGLLAKKLTPVLRTADLVVANTLACFWSVLVARKVGRPTLFYIHESTTPASFYLTRFSGLALRTVESAFSEATCVSFLTESTRRYYAHLPRRPNQVINPGWIDLPAIDAFREKNSRETSRSALNLPAGKKVVVNVGSVCDRKGQHIFCRAVDLIWQRRPDLASECLFLMIGARDTLYDQALASFVHQLGRENLRILSETSAAYGYYSAADLFVCTSYEESFPRVVLEAMAFSLPIVSTSVHGIPEIARDGREAKLVPPGETSSLADAMISVLDEPSAYLQIAKNARDRVVETYSTEKLLPRHHALACAVACLEN